MQILIVWIILVIVWLGAIFSVSIHESFSLTLKLSAQWLWDEPSNYFYFGRQIRNIIIWLIMAFIAYKIPLKFFQNNRNIIIISVLALILQLLVFIPGIGVILNGARWWISLGWVTTIQPAEFFKLGYVMFLASWFIRKKNIIQDPKIIRYFIILNVFVGLIFVSIPDMGIALVMAITGLIMLWYAGAKLKYIVLMGLSGIFLSVMWVFLLSSITSKYDYLTARLTHFVHSDVDPTNRGIWWQNEQALISIWWWWLLGQWYGKWLQKFGYIPEAQSDFVFAAFSEEIGFVGNMFILFLYFLLCLFFFKRLPYIRDPYSRMIGVGIISLIIIQMFITIGVNVRILPNTWLTLPFISYWGTAIMVNMIQIVLLYKIVRER